MTTPLSPAERRLEAPMSTNHIDGDTPHASDYPDEGPVPTSVQNTWNDAGSEQEAPGRLGRSGWHTPVCWRHFATVGVMAECVCGSPDPDTRSVMESVIDVECGPRDQKPTETPSEYLARLAERRGARAILIRLGLLSS